MRHASIEFCSNDFFLVVTCIRTTFFTTLFFLDLGLFLHPQPRVIEALLIADYLWLYVGYVFSIEFVPHWTPSTHFQLYVTAFLAINRSIYLYRHYFGQLTPLTEKKTNTKAAPSSPRGRSKSPRLVRPKRQ